MTSSSTQSAHEYLIVPSRQVEIPPTTPERYITGIYALNVQAPEGTSGDWHDVFHWREGVDDPDEVMLGGSAEVDTNHIYGDLGIYNGKDSLLAKGLEIPGQTASVYVANHFRAILDMVYHSLTHYRRVYNLTGATTDWLDTPEQQQYVLEQATRMTPFLPQESQQHLADWVSKELAAA
ncbi:hypothetical protein [Actinomyces israelii]|uniref:hypothetical protein n=1 Tax=Actinomyces israelii TaxID=1659 RepID=UPI0005B777C3|nr:hypothetical protein [Actinomyces israelii]